MPELRPYQETGARFLAGAEQALLGDDMGLGKTVQGLAAMRLMHESGKLELGKTPILIVCPATLKGNWAAEIGTWLPEFEKHVGIIEGKSAKTLAPISIVNYDIVRHNYGLLAGQTWQLCLVDEAQYLKHGTAQRTRGVYLGLDTRIRWAFSGTPIESRPLELYSTLWWLRQKVANSHDAFVSRYCAKYYNGLTKKWNYRGASNLQELQQKLALVMLRRTKADVLDQLPPKTRTIVPLLRDAAGALSHDEQALIDREDVRAGFNSMEQFQLQGGVNLGEIAKLRSALGRAKAPAALRFIREFLDGNTDQKIIVFAHHSPVIEHLYKGLNSYGVVRIDGSVPSNRRTTIVQKFQRDPRTRVFIGNIKAAGVGITLTAASTVVFVEYDWVPGVNAQAEDRAHRIGQNSDVNIFYLVLEKSIDAMVAAALVRKQNTLDVLLVPTQVCLENQSNTKTERQTNMSKIASAYALIASGYAALAEAHKSGDVPPTTTTPPPLPVATPASRTPRAKAAVKPVPATTAPAVELQVLIDQANLFMKKHGLPKTLEVLSEFGAKKVSQVPEDRRSEALTAFAVEAETEDDEDPNSII